MGTKRPSDAPRDCSGMSLEEMVRDLWKAHYGDNSAGRPGMMMRLDRVERKMKAATWMLATLLAAVIGAGVDWAKSFLPFGG